MRGECSNRLHHRRARLLCNLNTYCYVLPSGFTSYYKHDTELTLISTIYTELTAQKWFIIRGISPDNFWEPLKRKIEKYLIKTLRLGNDDNTKLNWSNSKEQKWEISTEAG